MPRKRKPDNRNKKNGGKGRKAVPKVAKILGTFTPKQSRFAKAFMEADTQAEAAIVAGYSPKNPSQSATQALNAIIRKGPEAMESLGLNLVTVIKNHLVPLLHSKLTKFAQHEGEFTDQVTVSNDWIRLGAVDKAIRLLGGYPPEDPVLAARISVDVIVADMPRPRRDTKPIDVGPSIRPPRKQMEAPAPTPKTSGNGAKPDPRPKD